MIAYLEQRKRLENLQQMIRHTDVAYDYCHQDARGNYGELLVHEIMRNVEHLDELSQMVKQKTVNAEMACVDMNVWMDESEWYLSSRIFDASTYEVGDTTHTKLTDAMRQLMESLERLHYNLQHAPAECYEQFHGMCTMRGAAQKAKRVYDDWKMENLHEDNPMQVLKDKRQRVVYEFYKKDFLRFTQDTTQIQQGRNGFEFDKKALPRNAECNADTDHFLACLNRYVKYGKDHIMQLQTAKIGKYIFDNFLFLTADDHFALTKFEVMLELIQMDMQEVAAQGGAAESTSGTGVLFTPEGMRLLKIAQQEGWLDESYRPVKLSISACAVLADAIAYKLKLKSKWKPFEELWGMKNLRTHLDRALNQPKTVAFQELVEKRFK